MSFYICWLPFRFSVALKNMVLDALEAFANCKRFE